MQVYYIILHLETVSWGNRSESRCLFLIDFHTACFLFTTTEVAFNRNAVIPAVTSLFWPRSYIHLFSTVYSLSGILAGCNPQ